MIEDVLSNSRSWWLLNGGEIDFNTDTDERTAETLMTRWARTCSAGVSWPRPGGVAEGEVLVTACPPVSDVLVDAVGAVTKNSVIIGSWSCW